MCGVNEYGHYVLMSGVGDLLAVVKYDRPPIALVVEVEGVT